jgi:hypothetical protein
VAVHGSLGRFGRSCFPCWADSPVSSIGILQVPGLRRAAKAPEIVAREFRGPPTFVSSSLLPLRHEQLTSIKLFRINDASLFSYELILCRML